jgi:hypothetical protein
MPGNQTVEIIRRQFDFSLLPCPDFLFEISPALLHALNLLVRSGEFRNRRRRFCKRMRLRQPVNTVHYRRVPLKTPIQTGDASYSQDNPKNHEYEAAPRKTT